MASGDFIVDGIKALDAGMNGGVLPILLPANQVSMATNVSFRGGYATHRPPIRKLTLDFGGDANLQALFESQRFQGACYYKPDYGPENLVVAIGGRLFKLTPDSLGNSPVEEITIPGDLNPAINSQAWLWQAENYVIWNDGQSRPVFWDGTVSRRANPGGQPPVGTIAVSPNTPPVGKSIQVTLAAPYTGNYGALVSANQATGELIGYFLLQAPATGTDVPNAILTNVDDTPATTIPQGASVIIPAIPPRFKQIGRLAAPLGASQPSEIKTISAIFSTQPSVTGDFDIRIVNITEAQINAVPNTSNDPFSGSGMAFRGYDYKLLNIVSANSASFQADPALVTFGQPTNTPIFQWSGTPAQNVGTTVSDFTVPPIGGTVNITLDQPYTGVNGTSVTVNGKNYKISQYGTPSMTVTLVNQSAAVGTPLPAGVTLSYIPELPPGKMGAYGMGRNWVCLADGRSFLGSDIVGGSTGTVGFKFRDAVLRISENTYLAGGGTFNVPGNIGDIRAMVFTANLDQSLGQGPLQVGTPTSFFSCQAPVARLTWQDLTNPILTQSLIGRGPLGQNSTILVNSDVIFRGTNGLGSLILARRDFSQWGNVPISREVQKLIELDNESLLTFSTGFQFDNRILESAQPNAGPLGVYHQALYAINLDPISSLRGKSASLYDGFWTGVNIFQLVGGIFGSLNRAYAFCFNLDSSKIELWEFLPTADQNNFDNGITPIAWSFESAALFNNIKGKGPFDTIELLDGEIQLSEIRGTVNIQAWYRPDYSQCWQKWINFNVCAKNTGDAALPDQQRTRLGLGQPDISACDPTTNQPYRVGDTFQVRFQIAGSCKFMGAEFKARLFTQSKYAPVSCDQVCDSVALSAPGETCVECLDQGTCIQFPLIFFNFGLGKSYTNPLLGIEVVCPNGETVISYVQPNTVNFQLPYPPGYTGDYPPLVLGCAAGGQVVRNVPSGATQSEIDAIVEDMILTCATAIAKANAPCRTIQFKSDAVYFDNPCAVGFVLVFNGTLPEWITLDGTNERLIGAAGTFFGATLEEANAIAQANIDDFGNAAVAAGTLKCVTLDWCDLVWSVINTQLSNPNGGQDSHSESCGNVTMSVFTNTGVGTINGSAVSLIATMPYDGPAANCNLKLTVSGASGADDWISFLGIDMVNFPISTRLSINPVPGSIANGVYNFPFTVPISVAQQIQVRVQHNSTFFDHGGGSTWHVEIMTL